MLTGGLLLALCCLSVSKVLEEFYHGSGDISEVLCDKECRAWGLFVCAFLLLLVLFVCCCCLFVFLIFFLWPFPAAEAVRGMGTLSS